MGMLPEPPRHSGHSTGQRLVLRLRDLLGPTRVPATTVTKRINRSRATRDRRAQGAWIWMLVDVANRDLHVGSAYTVTRLLKCQDLQVIASVRYGSRARDMHVDPCLNCPGCDKADRGG